MKALKIVFFVVLILVAIVAALFAAGTFWNIPVAGSMGSYVTVEYAHIFLPVCFGLFILSAAMIAGKKKIVPLFLTLLFAFSTGCGAYAFAQAVKSVNAAGADVQIFDVYKKRDFSDVEKTTAAYTTSSHGDVLLDVYHTDDGKTGKPVLLYIHGGGWVEGSRERNRLYATKEAAQAGFVSVAADYDLSGKDEHLYDSAEQQLTFAVAWVAKHAAEYGGDGEKIYIIGDSSGGHLALEVAYKINDGTYGKAGEDVLPQIKGVCALYPVADPALFYNSNDILFGKAAKTVTEYYTGTTPEKDPALYASITPKNHLSGNTPQTLLIVGEGDKDVPPESSYELYDALKENGTRTEIVRVKYANHAFDYVDGCFGSEAVVRIAKAFFGQVQN